MFISQKVLLTSQPKSISLHLFVKGDLFFEIEYNNTRLGTGVDEVFHWKHGQIPNDVLVSARNTRIFKTQ